jgi:hypothetical protein
VEKKSVTTFFFLLKLGSGQLRGIPSQVKPELFNRACNYRGHTKLKLLDNNILLKEKWQGSAADFTTGSIASRSSQIQLYD